MVLTTEHTEGHGKAVDTHLVAVAEVAVAPHAAPHAEGHEAKVEKEVVVESAAVVTASAAVNGAAQGTEVWTCVFGMSSKQVAHGCAMWPGGGKSTEVVP